MASATLSPRRRSVRSLNVASIMLVAGVFSVILYYAVVRPRLYSPERVTTEFHRLLYNATDQTWSGNKWLGHRVLKNPLDLWIVQEIIHEVRPDVLIETGTFRGGSALYFASLMDMIGNGKVITIDIEKHGEPPAHPRIQHLIGSSTAPEILSQVRAGIPAGAKVMVMLDSDHSRDHVLKELQLYGPLVTSGSYLIVEDTNINGRPVRQEFGPGPGEAVDEFMKTAHGFETDLSRERLFVTFNPRGFLRKN